MRRPLRAFLSYRRRDRLEASELERAFALRGVRFWRDVNDLPLGGMTLPEIEHGIRNSDAFVLYVTARIFSSRVIWETEVPAALRRAEALARAGRRYPIVPVLRGISWHEFKARCDELDLPLVPKRNAADVPLTATERATPARRRAAFATIARRLLRTVLAEPAAQTRVLLRSFEAPEAPAVDIDINWFDAVEGMPERTWSDELFPALQDLKAELGRARRRELTAFVKARLGVALAAGMVFPLASGFEISVYDRQGRWDRKGKPVLERAQGRTGARARAVLEISLAQDAGAGAARLARALEATHVRLLPPNGPSRAFDPRPHAGAIATQVGDLARELRSAGVRDLHVVLVAPAALGLLVGRQLHVVGRLHSYFRSSRGGLIHAYAYKT